MFAKILVPIQSKEKDRFVFEKALTLAKQTQASLLLIHVFSPEDESQPVPTPTLHNYPVVTDDLVRAYRMRWEEAENQGLEMLKALAKEAEIEGIVAEFTQNIGSRGQVICKMAEHWEADLVVVRQPGRSRLNELFLGSTGNYIVHHAHCPVLAV